jgi:hypothetical protein
VPYLLPLFYLLTIPWEERKTNGSWIKKFSSPSFSLYSENGRTVEMLNLKIRFPEEFRYTVRMFPV